jgi:hypothetical protein
LGWAIWVCSLSKHMKLFHEFHPSVVTTYFSLFKQLVDRGSNWFEETISKRLHDHSFFNIIFDMSFDLHRTHLKSCARLGTRAWLFVRLVISWFCLPLNVD